MNESTLPWLADFGKIHSLKYCFVEFDFRDFLTESWFCLFPLSQTFTIFGRDMAKIPCFRESLLNGIIGGIAIGMATFLRTSRPKKACDYAVGSYTLITLSYYAFCRYVDLLIEWPLTNTQLKFHFSSHPFWIRSLCNRYSWSKEKHLVAQLQEGMRRQALYQGTDMDREIRAELEKEEMKEA